jgi:7,8-dihydro-6-hydroxymethylpterin-pyrophosphokinase
VVVMSDDCKCDEILELIKETEEKVGQQFEDGSNDDKVDADIIKTHKAMFFEKVKHKFKK